MYIVVDKKCPTPLAALSQHSDLFHDRKAPRFHNAQKQAMVNDSSFYATCNAADPYQSFQRAPRPTKAKWPSTESLPYPLT